MKTSFLLLFKAFCVVILLSLGLTLPAVSQVSTMHVYINDGSIIDVPLGDIASIDFTQTAPPPVLWFQIYTLNGDSIIVDAATIDSVGYTSSGINGQIPYVITESASLVDSVTVTANAILYNSSSPVTHKGFCWSTDTMPTTLNDTIVVPGSNTGAYSVAITGLTTDSVYYIRSYAINSAGIRYGNQVSIMPVVPMYTNGNGVYDIEGNFYPTIIVDDQEWMAKNLRTHTYNDGTPVQYQTNNGYGSYRHVNGSISNTDVYGSLYDWYAMMSTHGLCPVDWHAPNDWEWSQLIQEFGGTALAGDPLKASGFDHWSTSSTGTNSSGFGALPAGYYQSSSPMYLAFGLAAVFWSSQQEGINQQEARIKTISSGGNIPTYARSMNYGHSVRCLKNAVPSVEYINGVSYPNSDNGTVTSKVRSTGGAPLLERGVCWSLTPNPTINDFSVQALQVDTGIYHMGLSGLMPLTTYYIRSYATNSYGIGYSEEQTLTTLGTAPVVQTLGVSNNQDSSAVLSGNIINDGGSPVTDRGICIGNITFSWNYSSCQTELPDTGNWSSLFESLEPNFDYYYYAYATNDFGTTNGDTLMFTSGPSVPYVDMGSVYNISTFETRVRAHLYDDNGAMVTSFGICLDTVASVSITSDTFHMAPIVTSEIYLTDLLPGTAYFVRAFAINSVGISYSSVFNFTTYSGGTPGNGVVDIEGTAYRTVMISGEEWMAENLRTSHYNDGTPIMFGNEGVDWQNAGTSGVYTWMENDSTSSEVRYGKLYNGHAVIAGNVCPIGWHVPTEQEWDNMINSQGGFSNAGSTLRFAGNEYWDYYYSATSYDNVGFAALPGSSISLAGLYEGTDGQEGAWWSSSYSSYFDHMPGYKITYDFNGVDKTDYSPNLGMSVRCVKD